MKSPRRKNDIVEIVRLKTIFEKKKRGLLPPAGRLSGNVLKSATPEGGCRRLLPFPASRPSGGPSGGVCPAGGQLVPLLLFNNGMRALPPEAEKILALEHPTEGGWKVSHAFPHV